MSYFKVTLLIISLLFVNSGIIRVDAKELTECKKETNTELNNDREYEWYVDQYSTGSYKEYNCGLACIEMCCKWLNKNTLVKSEDLRKEITTNIIYVEDIESILNNLGIIYKERLVTEKETIKSWLDRGNICIMCINTAYITNETDRIGKFYQFNGGHYILIKGYKYINNKLYFLVYDPYSMNKSDELGLLGKDIYINGEELYNSCKNWWEFLIEIKE